MKKVLILAYDFPPYVSAGALRPYSWYKHFKEYGIEPIVVTRQWANKYGNELDYIAPSHNKTVTINTTKYGTIIETPFFPDSANRIYLKYRNNKYKLIRKYITAYYEFLQWFLLKGSKSIIYKSAVEYLKENKVDVIIATGEPFILFRYASLLSDKFKIPWIADYRDPWSQNKARNRIVGEMMLNRYSEKKYLKNVNLIITVSGFFQNQISSMITQKNFKIIPNGYDFEIDKKIKQNSDVLSIAFVGSIYNYHPIKSVLKIFDKYLQENEKEILLSFYGVNIEEEVKILINNNYKYLQKYVKFYPKKNGTDLKQELLKYNAFLLFNDYSILGTKIYNYLALRRKILFCYSNDKESITLKKGNYISDDLNSKNNHLQEDIIKLTKSGVIVENSEHLVKVLYQLFIEFESHQKIICNSVNIEQYSRKIQVEKLAKLLKEV